MKNNMKKVPLLPNLITTGNLFCGFLSILSSLRGDFTQAGWLILAAMIFDFFDGQVARLQKASSEFGLEYDSLCDLVSFGLAPSILTYQLCLNDMGRIGIAVAFLYTACAALRLARFNVRNTHAEKKSFLGLPSPAAAGMVASAFILENEFPEIYSEAALTVFLPFLLVLVGLLMVSNVKYPAIQSIETLTSKPFVNLVVVVAGAALVLFNLEIFLFLCFLLYVLAGMWQELRFQQEKRKSEVTLHNDI